MIRNNFFLLFLLAGLILTAASCGAAVETAADAPSLSTCLLNSGIRAECGVVTVPENWDDENGRQLDIHFAIVRAENRAPQPDPVFMLAGGPGQSAIEAYPFTLSLFDRLNQNRDIVLVDQRGTGQSNPLECPNLQELPIDSSEEVLFAELDLCRQNLSERADLSQYITDIAMRDLDRVRELLGYPEINLFGTSYGSRAAMSYMRLYPERVRTAVLNAVTSPELVIFLQSPVDGQRALELTFARCAADPACQATFPDFETEFKAVAAALGDGQDVTFAHPTTGERLTFTMTEADFMQGVFNLLYSPDLISLLPLLINDIAETGDYGPLMAQVVLLRENAGLYQGMFYAVTCSEDAARINLDNASEIQEDVLFPLVAEEFVTSCENWPIAAKAEAFREPLTTDIPTLLLSGEADPITPPRYANQVATGLSNHVEIVLPGQGHDISLVGCMPTVITEFIISGSTADLDIECTKEIVPPSFFVSPAGTQP